MNLRVHVYKTVIILSFALIAMCEKSKAQQIRTETISQEFSYTIRPSVRNEVVLTVIQHATCEVSGHNSGSVTFFSDSEGYGHFFITAPKARATPIVLRVKCTGTTGNGKYGVRLYPSNIPVPGRPEVLNVRPRPDHIRPALSAKEIRDLSQSELERRGYGVRPDKANDPKAYSVWIERVSRSVDVYRPEPAKLGNKYLKHYPDHVRGSDTPCATANIMCPLTSNNWNAFMIDPASPVLSVTGRWNVPNAAVVSGLGFYQHDESSTWVGIDGYGLIDLGQGGTDQQVSYVFFNGSPSKPLEGVWAWTELLPNQQEMVPISNFWVNPGDDVYVSCSVVGVNLNCSISDFTRSSETDVVTPLDGTTVTGQTAEWVMERPRTPNKTYTVLPGYGQFSLVDAVASLRNGTGGLPIIKTFENAPGFNVTMLNTAQQVLSSVADTGSDTMQFTWVAAQ